MTLRSLAVSPKSVLWFLSATIAFGGGVGVLQTLEPQIALERSNRYEAARNLESDRAVLSRAEVLIAQRKRDRRVLRGIDIDGDAATTVARFVSDMARVAAQTQVTVTQLGSADKGASAVAPLAAPPVVTLGAAAPLQPAFVPALAATKLAVKLDGRYRDLLAAMRAFTTLGVLAELDVAGLERTHGDRLSATLSVALYRRASPSTNLRRKVRSDGTFGSS